MKIKLSHTEVEHKLFLEVLGVYAILAFVLVGAYYLEPAITGFVTVEKQVDYTDEVDLQFSESQTYVWTLGNTGNLKSVKIDGSMDEDSIARVYIENDGIRYLIFDSSKLVEKESGLFGITGFVVAENKSKGNEPNHPPVWNSSVDSFIVNKSLIINLNEYFNDKDNDALAYSVSELKTNDLEVLLENSILTVNNRNDVEGNRTLEVIASDNETTKKKNIALVLIKKIVINETTTNETIEKIIDINLEYGNNEFYDANNDGVENTDGIIDFAVDGSFNWDIDESRLCTRYEVFSVQNQESELACFGNNNCCNFVGLESSRELWNESLFLSFGGYGSTDDNLVFAQILHVDYDLSSDSPYTDIAYSSWDNKTAEFVSGFIEFEDVCAESCVFEGNATSYNLIVEIENGELRIGNIDYIIEERVANNVPELVKEIEDVTVTMDGEYVLDLSLYFSDEDGDELSYSYSDVENMTISFEDGIARIVPDNGFVGIRLVVMTASDSHDAVSSNAFAVDVVDTGIELLDVEKRENIIVSFLTYGINNLTISAVGLYAEFFNDNATSDDNLEIIELSCGDFEIFDKDRLIETSGLWFILQNGSRVKMVELVQESASLKSMLVEDYFCSDISYLTAKVLGGDNLAQEIKFGGMTITADVFDVIVSNTFEIRDADDNKLAVFDSLGNVGIKGNLTENSTGINDGNDFMIQDSDGSVNLVITNPEGNMVIRGFLNENQGILSPGFNSFIIQNNLGEVAAYVDSTGNVYLRGILSENVVFG